MCDGALTNLLHSSFTLVKESIWALFFVMRRIFKVALRDDEFETEKAERGAKKDGRKNQRRDGEGGGWKND